MPEMSLPMRGEWIEIPLTLLGRYVIKSLPMRGEWIEIMCRESTSTNPTSLPMRGEWIEIYMGETKEEPKPVSPHAGRVD